ncbi:MAG: hypothetical protein RR800_14445, partial [Comamonas sp.]
FSIMGAALAVSPVFGLVSGGWIVSIYGHIGVFIALSLLAILLLDLLAVLTHIGGLRALIVPCGQRRGLAGQTFLAALPAFLGQHTDHRQQDDKAEHPKDSSHDGIRQLRPGDLNMS